MSTQPPANDEVINVSVSSLKGFSLAKAGNGDFLYYFDDEKQLWNRARKADLLKELEKEVIKHHDAALVAKIRRIEMPREPVKEAVAMDMLNQCKQIIENGGSE